MASKMVQILNKSQEFAVKQWRFPCHAAEGYQAGLFRSAAGWEGVSPIPPSLSSHPSHCLTLTERLLPLHCSQKPQTVPRLSLSGITFPGADWGGERAPSRMAVPWGTDGSGRGPTGWGAAGQPRERLHFWRRHQEQTSAEPARRVGLIRAIQPLSGTRR